MNRARIFAKRLFSGWGSHYPQLTSTESGGGVGGNRTLSGRAPPRASRGYLTKYHFSVFMQCRLEKYGSSYRLLGMNIQREPRQHHEKEIDEEGRAASNITRARSRIRELGLCNEWEWFATFTLAEGKQDRFDLPSWVKDFGNWIQNFKRKYRCSEFAYLIIPEQHKNGAWHAHGLLHGLPPEALVRNEHGYYDLPYYRNRFGFISLGRIRDPQKVASYITKYVTKDTAATASDMNKGAHLFYASRGLKEREIVTEWIGDFQADWENEYCKMKWLTAVELMEQRDTILKGVNIHVETR